MPGLTDPTPVIMIHTADRARALPFWRDVIGLPLLAEDGYGAVFRLGGAELRLVDIAGWTPHPHTVLGLTVADIEAAMDSLAAAGVTFLQYEGFGQDARGIWTAPDGHVRLAWFCDPDGNNLLLSESPA